MLLLTLGLTAHADSVLSMNYAIGGRNIYASSLLADNGAYVMWYGGWQSDGDLPNDKIYMATSPDDNTWTTNGMVLYPQQVAPNAVHVNDPSVTKHFNAATGTWQYTMFYTVCVNSCGQADNQIWSSVSSDGVYWVNHQQLLAGPSGPAEPSAVIDPQSDGTFWKVYYVDRMDPTNVKVAYVNGNRGATAVSYAYFGPGGAIANPEVQNFNGKWHLFFNAYFATSDGRMDHADIYKVESATNTSWSGPPEVLISNTGPTYCGTFAPGVLPVGGNQYDMFFGLTARAADGTCPTSEQRSIQRWRWAN